MNLFRFFQSQERELPPETYEDAKRMLAKLEAANHRLAARLSAHEDYLGFLSARSDRDHHVEFDMFYLNNAERYSDGVFPARMFKHRQTAKHREAP